jgi:catechol 2,3-dioxygenase-like lactoylglutathione lyase family enzyme
MSTRIAEPTHNVRQAVPFLWVHALEASRRFYVDGLGFQVTRHWTVDKKMRWCWIELGDAALMLQEYGREDPRRNLPETAIGVGVSVAFICADALEIFRTVTGRGIDATRPTVGNGMWVTHVIDPDGYRLFFESPTDVPEDTVLVDQ